MKRFLMHGLAWLLLMNVVTSVAAAGSSGGAGGSSGGAARGVGGAQAARVGREFKQKAGRAVALEGGRLRLRFAGVASDSRCPVDADCVWAGNAEVLIEVGAKDGKRTLRLNTNAGRQGAGEGRYGRYTVKLLGLSPQPRAGRKIKAGEYTATLLVTNIIVD